MAKYKSISIPLTVIIPPNAPDKPIILRDVYTRAQLVEKIKEAARMNSSGTAFVPSGKNAVSMK